eukprot:6404172-Amphidinium_carterae.4
MTKTTIGVIPSNNETSTAAKSRALRTTTMTQFRRTPQGNTLNRRQLAERNNTTTMMILESNCHNDNSLVFLCVTHYNNHSTSTLQLHWLQYHLP